MPCTHKFEVHSYRWPTYCSTCGNMLVGFRHQGLQCSLCLENVHSTCAFQFTSVGFEHDFQLVTFHSPTTCLVCRHLIWGVTHQGYRCENCSFASHKACVKKECDNACKGNPDALSQRIADLINNIMPEEFSQRLPEIRLLLQRFDAGVSSLPPDAFPHSRRAVEFAHRSIDQIEQLVQRPFFWSAQGNARAQELNSGHSVISVPADGNCLFRSLIVGLQLASPLLDQASLSEAGLWRAYNNEQDRDQAWLRGEVVRWIEERLGTDERLAGLVDETIAAYNQTLREKLQSERENFETALSLARATDGSGELSLPLSPSASAELELRTHSTQLEQRLAEESLADRPAYLRALARDGFWGSEAEVYALSCMFSVEISLRLELQPGQLIPFSVFRPPSSDSTASLARIQLLNKGGSHFDAMLLSD